MKNFIKKWLSISQDELARTISGSSYFTGVLDGRINEKINYENEKRKSMYVDCYKCGVFILRLKAIPKAILDSENENNKKVGVLNQYNLSNAFHLLRGDENYRIDSSSTIHYCNNCAPKK